MKALENSTKSHGTKFFGFSNSTKYIKTFLFYANFHICPLKNNHLKFRLIKNVTMWKGGIQDSSCGDGISGDISMHTAFGQIPCLDWNWAFVCL